MPVSASVAQDRFRQLAAEVSNTLDAVEAAEARLRADLERVREALGKAALGLAGAYLPALERPVVERAARLTGYRGFQQRDPFAAMEREAQTLKKTIARIVATDEYRRREALVGPYGTLAKAVQEARDMLAPWAEECRRYEDLPGWQELIDTAYDTPAFDVSFLEPRYWRLWARGDEACAALGLDDFGDDVLPAWKKVEGERARWREEVARAEAKVKAVHELVREHDQALQRIPRLPEVTLGKCRSALAEWLKRADVGLLGEWLRKEGEDRGIQMALRELAGNRAKEDFLQETLAKGIGAAAADLRDRKSKLVRKAAKYGRPKNYGVVVSDAELAPGLEEKLVRMRAETDRLRAQVDRMVAYDRYDRFDLDNDPELWWIEFTGHRPGRFNPGLRDWYTRHPDVRVRRDEEVVAVVAAAADAEAKGGYLS